MAVRDYLEREGLLETKEKKELAEVYGLLSNVGSHPYIAGKDQARLLRQQALLLSQFVMLRYQGYLRAHTAGAPPAAAPSAASGPGRVPSSS